MKENSDKKKNRSVFKKTVIILLIILIAIILATAIFVYNKLSKIEHIELKDDEFNVEEE